MKSETQESVKHISKQVMTLGFSPCPNDTFMFDAMVNGRIDTGEFKFDIRLEDVETLNLLALEAELDITKLSFAAYSQVIDKYQLLTSGSALGNGVGPLFISKKHFTEPLKEIKSIAIPGKHTTAYFLFKTFYPQLTNVKEYIFSEIELAIINDEVDAGIIIHENRFTYAAKGLKKIADLGQLWENKTGMPIPLGGIAIRRTLSDDIKKNISGILKKSIQFAFSNPEASKKYVKDHSQEMSDDVIQKHIDLYVNEYSLDLNEKAKEAIRMLLRLEEMDTNFRELFI
jgi:1,4-dihydroxy-6-naphthoate synthase